MEVVILGYHGVPMLEPQTYFVLKSMSENMREKLENSSGIPLCRLCWSILCEGEKEPLRVEELLYCIYSWYLRMRLNYASCL